MAQLSTVISHVDGHELSITGAVGARNSNEVRTALWSAVAQGSGDLIVHLSEGDISDQIGLGVLVGAHHRAKTAGRRLVIADASPRVRRLMCATKLNRVMGAPDSMTFVKLAQTV